MFTGGRITKMEDPSQQPATAAPHNTSAQPPAPSVAIPPAAPSDRSVTPNRTLLIHGYSASGKEFGAWKAALA